MGTGGYHSTRDELHEALARSCFAGLAGERIGELLSGAILHHVPRSQLVSGDGRGWFGLVVSGLVRTFLWTPDGRQVTVQVARRGDVIGAGTVVGTTDQTSTQAVGEARVLELDRRRARDLLATDTAFVRALAAELSGELATALAALEAVARRSVRARLCHFLVSASFDPRQPDERPMAIEVSHEDIACAIGTAREVVTRHLAELSAAGLVVLGRGSITLTCIERLREVA